MYSIEMCAGVIKLAFADVKIIWLKRNSKLVESNSRQLSISPAHISGSSFFINHSKILCSFPGH